MKELVVISGKGGTGKTSLLASFAALAKNAVCADCDVDAADLHLILSPAVLSSTGFWSGHEAVIRRKDCIQCGSCFTHCRFSAVQKMKGSEAAEFSIDPVSCEGCGVCVRFCPVKAIDFPEKKCGEWFLSRTRFGPMVHARLGIAAENSGKLVTVVRKEARRLAQEAGSDLILVDGPPGIGCAAIASISGASFVVVVTEPTLSGEHDLERVLSLTRHFGIRTAVCVNKWDLNQDMADRIERKALVSGCQALERISYDRNVTAAQVNGKAVVEYRDCPAAQDIRKGWQTVCHMIG
ncbi:MAG: ATP-binding protein [bacterium]